MKYSIECTGNQMKVIEQFIKGCGFGHNVTINHLDESNSEDYNKGLVYAWDLAKKISLCAGFNSNELDKMFGTGSPYIILENYSIFQVIEKVNDYFTELAEAEINVGDEITFRISDETIIGVVFDIADRFYVLDENGVFSEVDRHKNNIIPTGRHFNEIDKLLEKMRNEKSDENKQS